MEPLNGSDGLWLYFGKESLKIYNVVNPILAKMTKAHDIDTF